MGLQHRKRLRANFELASVITVSLDEQTSGQTNTELLPARSGVKTTPISVYDTALDGWRPKAW
jgi:hypothetical protein